jgi:hypothetical protein
MACPEVAVGERATNWRVGANIFNKQSRRADTEWSSRLGVGQDANKSSPLRNADTYGQVAGTCECGDEHSGYVKCEEFLD